MEEGEGNVAECLPEDMHLDGLAEAPLARLMGADVGVSVREMNETQGPTV